jgi:predicted TIM-barrel fold metal-dependent hydrolase
MIFDAHFHVIDPRFRLQPNQGFVPEPFGVADYVARVAALDVAGGAVVSGSFQAFDQGYLRAALAALGERFVGVTQLPLTATDDEINDLDAAGVRAVRFNFRRGGSAGAGDLDRFARRLHDVAGWHVEIYADAATLTTLEPVLAELPAVVLDHLGLERSAQPILRRLVERGARVKATGFGRLDFDPVPAVRELLAIDPASVVFGTDLPSTRAPRPFEDADVEKLADALDPSDRERVLYTNALALYRPRSVIA